MEKTVISNGTIIEGNILTKTDLVVFGAIDGKIESNESVHLENGCNVVGEIIAKTLFVKGKFNGNADCSIVNIEKDGKFTGNIKSNTLIIDSKGSFEGKNEVKKVENVNDNNMTISEKKLHKELDTDNILL